MWLLAIFVVLLSTAFAKPVESDVEKFECIANYLRDKKLLDKSFKYFVQSQPLNCDSYVDDLRETFMQEIFSMKALSSSEEDEEEKASKFLLRENSECFKQQLLAIKYPELMMKLFVYSKSTKTSKKQKKKLMAETEQDLSKRFSLAMSLCLPDTFLGEMFDEIMTDDDETTDLEDKQNEYCIRKYVVENQLIDSNIFKVNLNPENIELNFQCEDVLEDLFEILEETLKETFQTEGNQSRKQLRCLSKTIRDENAVSYLAKMSVLSELQLTSEQKADLRTEFIIKVKKLYEEMLQCIV